jgi:formylglycine-generating enzyme required for sulfatase activity
MWVLTGTLAVVGLIVGSATANTVLDLRRCRIRAYLAKTVAKAYASSGLKAASKRASTLTGSETAWIPGGQFWLGTADQRMADARPWHRVYVDSYWMDTTEVTNEQFAKFVKATRYVTVAERKPRAKDYPHAPPEKLVAGSVVFSPPDHPVETRQPFWLVALYIRCELAPSRRSWLEHQEPDEPSGCPRRL